MHCDLILLEKSKELHCQKNIVYADNKSQLEENGGKNVNKRKTSCLVVSNDSVKGQLGKKDKKSFQMTVIAQDMLMLSPSFKY